MCLPYFVTNSGGVLGGTMEFASVNKKKIEEFIDLHIGSRLTSILDEADRQNLPSVEIAETIALRCFEKVRQASAQPKVKARLFELALDLYRRGLIPRPIVGSLAPRYFERIL